MENIEMTVEDLQNLQKRKELQEAQNKVLAERFKGQEDKLIVLGEVFEKLTKAGIRTILFASFEDETSAIGKTSFVQFNNGADFMKYDKNGNLTIQSKKMACEDNYNFAGAIGLWFMRHGKVEGEKKGGLWEALNGFYRIITRYSNWVVEGQKPEEYKDLEKDI